MGQVVLGIVLGHILPYREEIHTVPYVFVSMHLYKLSLLSRMPHSFSLLYTNLLLILNMAQLPRQGCSPWVSTPLNVYLSMEDDASADKLAEPATVMLLYHLFYSIHPAADTSSHFPVSPALCLTYGSFCPV